ncbi:MAG: hypothetical protein HWN69_10300 [Desulfobacterales bacterium]|nr:hypothetical protein [Desulfobacterales bacterium]
MLSKRGRYWPEHDVCVYNKALTSEEIRQTMRGDPFVASNPTPAVGAIFEDTWVSLSWKSGKYTISYQV